MTDPELLHRQWPLTGRGPELRTARSALADGRPLLLGGPGGVGKTRLLRAVVDGARSDGWEVRTATGTASARGVPLGALAHLIPSAVLDSARDQVLRAVLAALDESVGPAGRLLVCVDDAHQLDDASATLVAHLARSASSRLGVAVVVRDGDRPPEALEAARADERTVHLVLGPLDEEQVGELLASGLGGPVDPVTVHQLVRWTRGNALFLRELVRSGVERDVLRLDHCVWRWHGPPAVGPTLRDLIAARHARLDPAALEALEVVAVGEPLPAAAWRALVATDVADELERVGLVSWGDEGGRREVRVAHPLHAEVLRAALPVRRAKRVRLELAEALGADPADQLRRAVLLAEAGEPSDVDALLRAARRAWALRDTDLVERLAGAARWAGPEPEADYLLGETRADRGDYEGAVAAWLELLGAPLPEALRVRIAIAAASVLALTLHRAPEARDLLDAAAAEVTSGDARSRLAASRAALFLGDEPAPAPRGSRLTGRGDDRSDEVGGAPTPAAAPGVTDRGGDLPDQARVFAWLGAAREWLLDGRSDAVLADADQIAAVADRASEDLPMGEMFVGICHFFALVQAGRLDDAHRFAAVRRERSLLDPLPIAPATWSQGLGIVALTRGHLAEATTHLQAAAALLRGNDIGSLRHVLHELGLARATAGDGAGTAAALAEAATANRGLISPFVEDARVDAALLAAQGDVSGARRVLEAAGRARATPIAFYDVPRLHDLARYGAPAAAAAGLETWVGRIDGPVAARARDQASALAAGDAGGLEAAGEAFEAAGYDLDAAESFSAAAVAASTGDGRRARAAELVRRADAARDRCGPEVPRTPLLVAGGPLLGLTPREREVASLAAIGLTDAEIAERLSVSSRTVHAHLRAVYRKLDLAGRADLVVAVRGPGPGAGPAPG